MKAISATDIRYAYPDSGSVLNGITFEIEAGQCAGVVGPNGSGKSTLLLALSGLLPVRGRVEVLGRELTPASLREMRHWIGIVFQDPEDQLFMPGVLEDVALGPLNMGLSADDAVAAARRALNETGVAYTEARPTHWLSFGEKKRVALAAILAMDPRLLLLDEPTAGLDPRSRGEFMALVARLGRTRLIATHDLDLVRVVCDTVLVLDQGRIVSAGSPEVILDDDELLLEHGLAYRHDAAGRPALPPGHMSEPEVQ